MRRSLLSILYSFSLMLIADYAIAQKQNLKLWYTKPAEKWTDALPVGNGTLGAMIFGGVNAEHLQFNEQTLWSDGPRKYQRDSASKYLPVIRKLLFDGKQAEAEALAEKHFMGMKSNERTYAADSVRWTNKMHTVLLPKNDSNWKTLNLPTEQGWEKLPGFEGLDGAVWFSKTFEVPADWKGKNLVLSLGRIRDMDLTYVNGTKVGATNGNAYRKYTIPASMLISGKNQISIQVLNFNDKGGLTSAAREMMIYPEGMEVPTAKGVSGNKQTVDQTADNSKHPIQISGSWKYWIQDANPPAFPAYQAEYLPFGDLIINQNQIGEVSNYHRELDISKAIATTTYTVNAINFTREYFASDPQKVIAVHYKADRPGKISFDALLQTFHQQFSVKRVNDHTIALKLKVSNGVLHGTAYLTAYATKGKVTTSAKGISISNADEATLYWSAATSFKNYQDVSGNPDAICKQVTHQLNGKSYDVIKKAHIVDYQRYFNLFSIDLGKSHADELSTDERIRRFADQPDPGLLALYVQYARYLLISCSRPDSKLPANLQGIWNDQMTPPWGSKFTTNINLEMNYWPAEELNLSACEQPLFRMIKDLSIAGRQTAKINYNLPGWVLHHNTDIWLGTAPINASNHGIWVSGGAWLSRSLWEHYLYSKDKLFLQQVYPEMKASAEFFAGFLTKDPKTGFLISTPSNSPEHGGLVAGPTMDHQIIRDLFKNCIAASEALGTDPVFRRTLQEKYKLIAPNQIGKYGQLQEWMEDKDDTADTHRHVSHLWGVYPGTDITWNTSPKVMKAAEKSFQYRGDDGTGWSLAWKVNLMARFKQADHAMALVNKLLSVAENGSAKERGGVYHNLFDAHPPFQIDGNFGGAAGIAEMLLQSQENDIDLLPALPATLPDGEVNGICARGGFVLDLKWKSGHLEKVAITSKTGGVCHLKYGDLKADLNTVAGKIYTLNSALNGI